MKKPTATTLIKCPAPPALTLKRAQTLWQQSRVDAKQAQRLSGSDPVKSSFLSLQTGINTLATVAVLLRQHTPPMHSLTQLIASAADQPSFQHLLPQLLPACAELEKASQLNPFQKPPPNSKKQAKQFLQLAKQIRSTTQDWLQKQGFSHFS